MGMNNQEFEGNAVSAITVDRSRLNQNQYVLSLLDEGRRTGLISSQRISQIQMEMIQVLQHLIAQYTQGESTSVPTDTAEGIMGSLLYALDAYALNFNEPDEAIIHMNSQSVKDIHAKGVELLQKYLDEARLQYLELKRIKLDVPVEAYTLTIDESLPIFLKHYTIIFEAQNTMASIDYPLAIDDMRLQGIFYIKQYIDRLLMETRFCQFYSQQDLMDLITNYGKMARFNYRIELFNIFELVVNNALFSLLSGGEAGQIKLSEIQYAQLERMLMTCNSEQRYKLIFEAMVRLQKELGTDETLTQYLNLYFGILIQMVNHAVEIGSFNMLIITEFEEREKPITLMLNENERLNDVQMRDLLNHIMEMENKEEKAALIRKHFVSLYDYLDLLNAGCLFGDEYEVLFSAFSDIEIAILAKIVFYEELRAGAAHLFSIAAEGTDGKMEWEAYFISFMKKLDMDRIAAVEKLIHQIDYEEIMF